MEEAEYIQEPQNDGNYHNTVQDGFDGPLHWNEPIH
jgi:hypothetical protein